MSASEIEFPPPLTPLQRLQRATTFWGTALPIVANYYGLISRIKLYEILGRNITEEQIEILWNQTHAQGAEKLSATVTNLKGFYVKTAQIVSTRQDLFPSQYTDALSGFTDNLDPMPVELAKAVVTKELLRPDETFEDVFAEFVSVLLKQSCMHAHFVYRRFSLILILSLIFIFIFLKKLELLMTGSHTFGSGECSTSASGSSNRKIWQ
jgi:hypothetical protein